MLMVCWTSPTLTPVDMAMAALRLRRPNRVGYGGGSNNPVILVILVTSNAVAIPSKLISAEIQLEKQISMVTMR